MNSPPQPGQTPTAVKERNWWLISLVAVGSVLAIALAVWQTYDFVQIAKGDFLSDGRLELKGGAAHLEYENKFLDFDTEGEDSDTEWASASPLFSSTEWLTLSSTVDQGFPDLDDRATRRDWLEFLDDYYESGHEQVTVNGRTGYRWETTLDGVLVRTLAVPAGDRYFEATCEYPKGSGFADRCLAALKNLQIRR